MALYRWLLTLPDVSDVVLEAWLPDTHQRPDIMFRQNGQIYVLEYQCTPIATEFFERHDLYRAAGVKDIWICGYEKYLQPNMRTKTIDQFCVGYYSAADDILVLNPADNASKAVGYVTRRCGREVRSFLGYIECEYVQYKHERIPMLSTTLNNAYLDEGTVELTKLSSSSKIIAKCNFRSDHRYYPVEYTYNNVLEHIRYIYRKQGCNVYAENNSIYVDFHMNTLLGIMNESHCYCTRNQKEWTLPDIRYLVRTINSAIRECKRKYSAIRKTLNRIAIRDNPTLLLYPSQGKRYPLKVGVRLARSYIPYSCYKFPKSVTEFGFVEELIDHDQAEMWVLPKQIVHSNGQVIPLYDAGMQYVKRMFERLGFRNIHIMAQEDVVEGDN